MWYLISLVFWPNLQPANKVTIYIKHDDVLSSVHRKHLKAFWTFVNTLVKCKHQFVLIANWVSQRPWSQFEFNLTRGSKVSLQPHWRRLPPRVSVLSQERSSRQSQHSTALHKHTQETLVNKSFHFFPLSHYGWAIWQKYHITYDFFFSQDHYPQSGCSICNWMRSTAMLI